MPKKGTSRRTFMETTLAAGAGAVLLQGDTSYELGLRWCNAPVYPLSMKEVKVYRGALAPGVTAQLSLMIDGPGFQEPICVDSHTLCLDAALKTWPVRLAYNHLELVPGEYTYWVTMDVDQHRVVSALVRYELKPFTFGV